jgi:hypothetical protein
MLTGQSESGRMMAVSISDATVTKTLVKLQALYSLPDAVYHQYVHATLSYRSTITNSP